ncbi:MAG TPA: hypothetical protein VHY09_00145 [Candidatus Methylacidiphilales bacterium]|jgi:hypothetical protein|nr:hypothetical protein [Candidatus Methylacidiphilales bacterium]
MDPLHYKLVFSVADEDIMSLLAPSVSGMALISVIIAVTLIFQFRSRPFPARRAWIVPVIFLAGLSVPLMLVFLDTNHYLWARNTLSTGKAEVVEGMVEHYVPLPPTPFSKGRVESFQVADVEFYFSPTWTVGFHKTRADGSPIRDGLPVRIWYAPTSNRGNEILKLEIAEK